MQRSSRAHFAFGAAVAFALFAGPVRAEATQNEQLLYNVMFGGLHVGDVEVGLKQSSTGYTTEMKMSASGMLRLLQNFRADMHGEGAFVREGADRGLVPLPARYERAWSTDDIAANMTMNFDPSTHTATTQEHLFNPTTGKDMREEDLPWAGKRKLMPVPANMRTNVFDPMAAFVAARQQLIAQGAAAPGKSFRVPIYDGARRYDVVGKTGTVRNVTINGVERALMPVTTKIEPVFGFQRESEKNMREAEGKIYFTPDARFIPVQVIAGNDMFTGVLNLVADCREKPEACAEANAVKVN